MANIVDLWYQTLIENNIATEEEISLVCSINGQNEESFLDIVYSRTGLRSWEQLKSDGYDVPSQVLDDDSEEDEDD
jgi:hypothetical protein